MLSELVYHHLKDNSSDNKSFIVKHYIDTKLMINGQITYCRDYRF